MMKYWQFIRLCVEGAYGLCCAMMGAAIATGNSAGMTVTFIVGAVLVATLLLMARTEIEHWS